MDHIEFKIQGNMICICWPSIYENEYKQVSVLIGFSRESHTLISARVMADADTASIGIAILCNQ